jgi:hypothetical protein
LVDLGSGPSLRLASARLAAQNIVENRTGRSGNRHLDCDRNLPTELLYFDPLLTN